MMFDALPENRESIGVLTSINRGRELNHSSEILRGEICG